MLGLGIYVALLTCVWPSGVQRDYKVLLTRNAAGAVVQTDVYGAPWHYTTALPEGLCLVIPSPEEESKS